MLSNVYKGKHKQMKVDGGNVLNRLRALSALGAVPALALLAPCGSGPTAPLLALVSVAAWVCTGWLCLVAALEHGARLPGTVGHLTAQAVRRVAPSSIRALVRLAVGASLTASVLAGPAAHAEDRPPTVAGSSSDSLDWPGVAPVTAPPADALPSPAADPRPAVVPASTPDHSHASVDVVVHPGDCLWDIARHALGPGATEAQVAAAWPRWWAANRSVVGDHPDLIHPGDRLAAP
jgi:nucleoid-associated protein YgaU